MDFSDAFFLVMIRVSECHLKFRPFLSKIFPAFFLLGKYQHPNGSLSAGSWATSQKKRVYSRNRGGEENLAGRDPPVYPLQTPD